MSNKYKLHHKYQNKNQITNATLILNSLLSKGFNPKYIVDFFVKLKKGRILLDEKTCSVYLEQLIEKKFKVIKK